MNKKFAFCLIIIFACALQVQSQFHLGVGVSGSLPIGNTTEILGAGVGLFGEIGYTIKGFEILAKADKIFHNSAISGYSYNFYNMQISYFPFSNNWNIYGGLGFGYAQERIKIDFLDETSVNGSYFVYPEIGVFKSFVNDGRIMYRIYSRYIYSKPENVFQSINLGMGIYYRF